MEVRPCAARGTGLAPWPGIVARPNCPPPDAETVTTILQLTTYLNANPQACDSADGIARWWLPDLPAGAAGQAALQAALEFLQAVGLVECVRAADGRARWRRTDADSDLVPRAQAALAAAATRPGTGGQVH